MRSIIRVPKLLIFALFALLLVILLPASRAIALQLYALLGATGQLLLTILTISFATFIITAFLAPMEALGWWAGWYGDELDTVASPGVLVEDIPFDSGITRYVVYLDGIAQTEHDYLPEVNRFLDELAALLPDDILIIKGIMPYSVINRPLTQDRLLSFFWRMADRAQASGSLGLVTGLLTLIILLRNVQIVAVAADQRYGPIYNQGTAQILYNGLIGYGYQPKSKVPITFIGYSGGAQIAVGAAPYLKQALGAPITVISIAGIMSGNTNSLKLEHLYHLVGNRDIVERIGLVLFPRRWKLLPLSYWNRAKRHGKIDVIPMGPVGHNAGGGPLDGNSYLPDGRSYLQQTIDLVGGIIQGTAPVVSQLPRRQISNYERFCQAEETRPAYYPLSQTVDLSLYRPIAPWMGRLILPSLEQRHRVRGVLFEVHHAPLPYERLVGQVVRLRWNNTPQLRAFLRTAMKDVHFSEEARYSVTQGIVHPERLNHWQRVNPLESLAGSHPVDDLIVRLRDPVVLDYDRDVKGDESTTSAVSATTLQGDPDAVLRTAMVLIGYDPVQITGRYYALVQIVGLLDEHGDRFQVIHFNRETRQFDGFTEIVRIPQTIPNAEGIYPATAWRIEQSPCNPWGWYIYGAKNAEGVFVVQAIAPRQLLRLYPDNVITSHSKTLHYLRHQAWKNAVEGKGTVQSVLLCPNAEFSENAVYDWKLGDTALLIHVYGGIGGKKAEAATKSPLYFGHFAYGIAQVIEDPLSRELRFEIDYSQVYTHNAEGLVAGRLAWNRYMGDRQFGWLGTRPVIDILVKYPPFTEVFEIDGIRQSGLENLLAQLRSMMARYRIGDGTGGTYVGPVHNCAQDSNQALYTAIKHLQTVLSPAEIETLEEESPERSQRLHHLMTLGHAIKRELMPFGSARADWGEDNDTLGISPEQDAFEQLLVGLITWRALFPRLSSRVITEVFLRLGASVWVLGTSQVGGYDPTIIPVAPTRLG